MPAAPFQSFEWRRRDGAINSGPERVATTPAFDQLTLGLITRGLNFSPSVLHPTSTYAEKH